MSKCRFCNSEFKVIEGRRPRQFCNPNCRNLFYYYEKKKSNPAPKRGRPKKEIYDDRTNPLINEARDRDGNGVNNDENKPQNILEKILEYEKELSVLGQGYLAKRRASFLEGEILKLKKHEH